MILRELNSAHGDYSFVRLVHIFFFISFRSFQWPWLFIVHIIRFPCALQCNEDKFPFFTLKLIGIVLSYLQNIQFRWNEVLPITESYDYQFWFNPLEYFFIIVCGSLRFLNAVHCNRTVQSNIFFNKINKKMGVKRSFYQFEQNNGWLTRTSRTLPIKYN